MQTATTFTRKNSFIISKIQKSKSMSESETITNSKTNQQKLLRLKRKSLTLKNIQMNNNIYKKDDSKIQYQQLQTQSHSEIKMLKDIIKKKEQIISNKQLGGKTKTKRNGIQQYEYYDMIVRDLITQIKTRKSKQLSPHKNSLQIKISKPRKIEQNRYTKQLFTKQYRSTSPSNFTTIKFNPSKNKMKFSLSFNDNVYEKKITSLIQFLYKVNFSNSLYVDLSLSQSRNPIKVKIGYGNNSLLIKSLLKRRFWIEFTNSVSQSNFIWTQGTDFSVHQSQRKVTEGQKNQKKNPSSNWSRKGRLQSSNDQFLVKILPRSQIPIVNSYYEKSGNATGSCYQLATNYRVSNHIPRNCIIGSKKLLFRVMHWYYLHYLKVDPFINLPKTYHFETGNINSQEYKQYIACEGDRKDRVWIIKPGENTNRGNGIRVGTTYEIENLIKRKQYHKNGELKTFIVQKYLKPFLYNGRKFDIRHYVLLTSVNGFIKAYWYKEGYIRTSGQKFSMDDLDDQMVHLTNDAIQKHGQNYGKYETGNKISYSAFQRYLDSSFTHKRYNFKTQIIEEMKKITTDVIRASFQFMDPERKGHNFQFLGLDFMINNKFKPFLIQCNANPCLEISCPLLQRIIPTVVQHSIRLGFDPLFPPPEHYPPNARYQLCDRIIQKLKYELIFDEKVEGRQIRQKTKECETKFKLSPDENLQPDEDLFEDQGEELNQGYQIQ